MIWIAIAIIFFATGIWPIGLGVAAFGVCSEISKRNRQKQEEADKIKAELEALHKKVDELEAQKAVAAAIEKSESKREG